MVERAVPDGDGRNVVNVILVDFRGFDTLGEITVLAAAAIGAVALARAGRRRPADRSGRAGRAGGPHGWWSSTCRCGCIFPAVMVGSLYLLFAGHNQPGGGFVGGIVAGAAVALRYVAGGIDEVRRPVPGPAVDGARRRAAARRAVTALVPLLFGERRAGGRRRSTLDLPVLGDVEASPRPWSSTSASTWWSSAWCSWCSSRSATSPRPSAGDRA